MNKLETYNLSIKERIKLQSGKFKRYVYSGLIAGAILFVFLFVFTSILNIHYIISFLMAFVISSIANFVLNKLWVFKGFNPKRLTKQYYQFAIVGVIFFAFNFILLLLFVEIFNIWYLLAQALICAIIIPMKFLSHKIYVFSHR